MFISVSAPSQHVPICSLTTHNKALLFAYIGLPPFFSLTLILLHLRVLHCLFSSSQRELAWRSTSSRCCAHSCESAAFNILQLLLVALSPCSGVIQRGR